jgi:nitrogen fixation/metabolism regulation signal transduction histidine kinase
MGALFIAVIYLVFVVLWIVAECRPSVTRRVRLALGLVALLFAIPVTAFLAFALTEFSDNSYFSHAIKIIVSESVVSLKTGDSALVTRFQKLDEAIQGPMYENNQDLLKKAEAFQEEGEQCRHEYKELATKLINAPCFSPVTNK